MFSTMDESGSISSSDLISFLLGFGTASLRKNIPPNDRQNQRSRVDSFQITPWHLKDQTHTTRTSNHCQSPPLDSPSFPFLLSGTDLLTDCQAAQDIKWGIVRVLRCSGIDEELGSEGEGSDGRSEGCGVDKVGKG